MAEHDIGNLEKSLEGIGEVLQRISETLTEFEPVFETMMPRIEILLEQTLNMSTAVIQRLDRTTQNPNAARG
ncbi:unnamed protein product [Dimorphilus gyrociliatus]|uniref:Uncharacterized protein n=1 Tax=Dimorphilus gyrociliatus TaxID=2664684 RepID=A0A7I8VXI5_9ANNE|nr:unnamed protein product [Dimorphilus gyrociliatus]